MLKKIRHNLGMKILAVLFAVVIWFMVYINENPIETRQITIPLSVINEGMLASHNLRVLNDFPDQIEISVKGRKADVEQVTPGDFTAYLDFSGVQDESVKYIDVTGLQYLGDRNVTTEFYGSGRIGVNIDKVIEGEVPISVNITGEPAEGFSVAGTVLKPANFIAIDIKSLVQEVASAVVDVDVTGMKGTETVRKLCTVYDESGNIINDLSNQTAVDITINIAKRVPVEVKTVGEPADDHLLISAVSVPTGVLITGSEEDLDKVDSIATLPIDISGASESYDMEAALVNPPAGTALLGISEINAEITIESLFEKTVTINADDITLRYGNTSHKIYAITGDEYQVTVKGRQEVLDETTSKSLGPYIDLASTVDGESSLPLRFQNLTGLEQVTFPLVDMYIESKTNIEIPTEDIKLSGPDPSKYVYSFEDVTAVLSLRGLSQDLEEVAEMPINQMSPTVNVTGLGAGTYDIKVNLNLPDGVQTMGTFTVRVVVSDKPNE